MQLNNILNIVVIGAGGTGSALFQSLCRYLYSQEYAGRIIIVDGDTYDVGNIKRQQFRSEEIGMNKALAQANLINSLLPYFEDRLHYIDKYLSKDDLDDLLCDHTVVFNCADNNAIRKYVEEASKKYDNFVHICCGNDLLTGQVSICIRENGAEITPGVFNAVPDLNNDNDDRAILSCEQLAALPSGGQVIIANMMAATLALTKFAQLFDSDCFYQKYSMKPAGTTWFDLAMGSFLNEDVDELKLRKKK